MGQDTENKRGCGRSLQRLVILLAVLALAGCDGRESPATHDGKPSVATIATHYRLETISHDGHLWVVVFGYSYHTGGLAHHPDCPCRKQANEAAHPRREAEGGAK